MYRILREARHLGKVGKSIPHQRAVGLLARSAAIRHVDAGSCNGCELEIQALNGPHYALEQAGLRFTASPRHADVLLVTGPVTRHMAAALKDTYDAMAHPKKVLALGDCACTGGVFKDSYAVVGPVETILPVQGRCPGCPPKPEQILEALAALCNDQVDS